MKNSTVVSGKFSEKLLGFFFTCILKFPCLCPFLSRAASNRICVGAAATLASAEVLLRACPVRPICAVVSARAMMSGHESARVMPPECDSGTVGRALSKPKRWAHPVMASPRGVN